MKPLTLGRQCRTLPLHHREEVPRPGNRAIVTGGKTAYQKGGFIVSTLRGCSRTTYQPFWAVLSEALCAWRVPVTTLFQPIRRPFFISTAPLERGKE